jgi:hypothetical protein
MTTFAKILLTVVSLLSLANLAQPVGGSAEDRVNRARRGLLQSTGGLKRQSVRKDQRTVAICVG